MAADLRPRKDPMHPLTHAASLPLVRELRWLGGFLARPPRVAANNGDWDAIGPARSPTLSPRMTRMPQAQIPGDDSRVGRTAARLSFDRDIVQLRRRLVREAATAIEMLEAAVALLAQPDRDAIAAVLERDDAVDAEEVSIEEACLRIIALQQPLGKDLRILTFILKVNADVERVADHACSLAKIARKLQGPPALPTALKELSERVPIMCQRLMRAVLDEDVAAARAVVAMDEVIDAMNRRLFDEVLDMMEAEHGRRDMLANGLHLHRAGRELERVGDLMANIAEYVVFLSTGAIIRHEAKKAARGN